MIEMLTAALQTLFKLGVIFMLAFMIACTVFIVLCAIHGDIKISINRDETENDKEK